jgi:hypothetical protein
MNKRRDVTFDTGKFLSRDRIRVGLLMSALYLTAFEILKIAIIEGVKDQYVFLEEPVIPDEIAAKIKDLTGEDFATAAIENYRGQIVDYEQQVKVKKFAERDQHGLVPSCEWLRDIGVLTQAEVEDVKKIKQHRNEIAHELPSILVGKEFEVELEFLAKIRIILKKVEIFYAQSDVLMDSVNFEEVVLDNDHLGTLRSSRQIMLDQIIDTVREYLDQLSAEDDISESTVNGANIVQGCCWLH